MIGKCIICKIFRLVKIEFSLYIYLVIYNFYVINILGASHSDEMAYLFYQPIYKVNDPKPPAIGTKDRDVLEILTKMWTNFAKTGYV